MFRYVRHDLVRNPRRTLASLVGVALGTALFSGVLFFVDGSGASMTKRALAPVAIDMQRVLTEPLGAGIRLEQALVATGPLRRGETTRMELTVRNLGATPANEVLVNDKLPPSLRYVPGSSRRDSQPIRDVGGESPFAHGPGRIGLNIGSVAPRAVVRLTYRVAAATRVDDPGALPQSATISSREDVVPNRANLPGLVSLHRLRDRIAAIPGVAAANQLAFVEVPAGALRSGRGVLDRPLKVFGFEPSYAAVYHQVRVTQGTFAPGEALLSAEAAQALGAGPGSSVQLALPGASRPATFRVGGVADLSRARQLFSSRTGLKLEDFLYVADAIVLDPDTFRRLVIPAFRRASAARGSALGVKSPPTLEIDIQVDRALLNSDPGRAVEQTKAIARRVGRIAPEQDYLLDNISNTLTVARADATVARRMFLFLGLPGLLLAGFLAAYAGTILAASQRREQALLRVRGAGLRHSMRILVYRTAVLAGLGALLGTAAGFASILVILGPSALFEAATGQLARSAILSFAAGVIATGLAMFIPGRRALRRDVSGERRELALDAEPRWRRLRLDYAVVAVEVVAIALALHFGAFGAPSGTVSTGQATSFASHMLVLPLGVWFAGTILATRLFQSAARNLPQPRAPHFGPVVRGILARTLARRSRALGTGVTGVALVVAFGLGIAVFAATYSHAKQADAEFTVGSNLRVTPSPASLKNHTSAFVRELEVAGVESATPVVGSLENAFMRSRFNSDVQDLAAIDPAGFARTATVSDQFIRGSSAAGALGALRRQPSGVLVNVDTAAGLKLRVGDRAEVLLARGTKRQQLRAMKVVGLFTRFPGFPEGLDIVANLAYFQRETGIEEVDFFLVRTADSSTTGLRKATEAIRSGPGSGDRLALDTTQTTFNKEQSSLTALNVRGLVQLDSAYTLAIAGAVITIFVLGLMLQRRREYVVLRAQGLPAGKLQALVLGEAAFVAASGLLAGAVVGVALGALLVQILEPLFILTPAPTAPLGDTAVLAASLVCATLAASAVALVLLRRLSPSEVLREQ